MNVRKSINLFILLLVLASCRYAERPAVKRVAVYGDSRNGHSTHRKIVEAILETDSEAVFHTGDLVNDGTKPEQWKIFNEITAEMREAVEFYPALGNHEKNSRLYFENFDLPNNERWYSVDRGGIHFIVLDTNFGVEVGSEQYVWLERELKETAEKNGFKAVIFHHPPISTGPHIEDEMALRNTIVPLLEKYGVDIVFNGHDHAYERSLYNASTTLLLEAAAHHSTTRRDRARTARFSRRPIISAYCL